MNDGSAVGYVRLFRKMLQNPIWTQLAPAVAKVAVYFLLRANYKPAHWYDGYRQAEIPAGSFITSYARTADACNLSIQQVRDAFAHLFRTHFATYTRTKHWTLVTVLNWPIYQASDGEAEHTEEHTLDRDGTAIGTTDKELRIKNTTTGADAMMLVPPPETTKKRERKSKEWPPDVQRVARNMHARHPANLEAAEIAT
jgi:hypothetical protein